MACVNVDDEVFEGFPPDETENHTTIATIGTAKLKSAVFFIICCDRKLGDETQSGILSNH